MQIVTIIVLGSSPRRRCSLLLMLLMLLILMLLPVLLGQPVPCPTPLACAGRVTTLALPSLISTLAACCGCGASAWRWSVRLLLGHRVV